MGLDSSQSAIAVGVSWIANRVPFYALVVNMVLGLCYLLVRLFVFPMNGEDLLKGGLILLLEAAILVGIQRGYRRPNLVTVVCEIVAWASIIACLGVALSFDSVDEIISAANMIARRGASVLGLTFYLWAAVAASLASICVIRYLLARRLGVIAI